MTSAEIMTAARDIASGNPELAVTQVAAELVRLHDGAAWSSTPPTEPWWYWYKQKANDKPFVKWFDGGSSPLNGGFWLRAEPADSAVVAELRQENERLRSERQQIDIQVDRLEPKATEAVNEFRKMQAELADCQRRLAEAERAYDKRLAELTTELDALRGPIKLDHRGD